MAIRAQKKRTQSKVVGLKNDRPKLPQAGWLPILALPRVIWLPSRSMKNAKFGQHDSHVFKNVPIKFQVKMKPRERDYNAPNQRYSQSWTLKGLFDLFSELQNSNPHISKSISTKFQAISVPNKEDRRKSSWHSWWCQRTAFWALWDHMDQLVDSKTHQIIFRC